MVSSTTSRRIHGTNIAVATDRSRTNNATVNRWLSVQPYNSNNFNAGRRGSGGDKAMEFIQSLRPEKKLIDPSEAFAQATKTLRPAVKFNTYSKEISRKNRQGKRDQHSAATAKRREERMVPNPSLRSALNPKKLPPASLELAQLGEPELMDEARIGREEASRKLGVRVKKLGKNKNRKDFRDPRERKTVVGDEL